jgi:pimeloyl-ACP methyl ester carboxylesterase
MNAGLPISHLATDAAPRLAVRPMLATPLPEAVDAPRRVLQSARAGRISYYADESGSGRPLVLVHSINAAPSAFEMRPLFLHFRGTRPVFAPDLPGFGFSERSERRYSPELYADALVDLLAEVADGPVDLVAFSLSAEFAARAALAAPERIRSLVMLSPTGLGKRTPPSDTVSRRAHGVLSLPLLSGGLFDLLTVRPSIRFFLGQSFVGEPPREMIDYAYATAHQPGAKHAPLYFLSGQLFTRDACDGLYARLTHPALVLYDRDANISFDLLPGLVAGHDNWQAERIAPTLGIPQWEKTAETVAAMERFWAALGEP